MAATLQHVITGTPRRYQSSSLQWQRVKMPDVQIRRVPRVRVGGVVALGYIGWQGKIWLATMEHRLVARPKDMAAE